MRSGGARMRARAEPRGRVAARLTVARLRRRLAGRSRPRRPARHPSAPPPLRSACAQVLDTISQMWEGHQIANEVVQSRLTSDRVIRDNHY
jgi:hypothetical protein